MDLPSGVDADTGDVDGVAFDADVTATPGCLKPGLFLCPDAAMWGMCSWWTSDLNPNFRA